MEFKKAREKIISMDDRQITALDKENQNNVAK